MTSSQINTLFTTHPPPRTQPGIFIISILVHGLAFGVALAIFMGAPRSEEATAPTRYTTRVVKLQTTDPQLEWAPGGETAQTTPPLRMRAATPAGQPTAAAKFRLPAYRVPAPVTLVQPDIPQNALPLTTPMPLIVMWTPPEPRVEPITPPTPQPKAPANVRPSLSMPNRETKIADVQMASTSSLSQTIPLPASTTSPLTLRGQEIPQLPQTTSISAAQPTPATALSISDVILSKGTVELPPVNQTAAAFSSEGFAPGLPQSTSRSGNGPAAGKQNGATSEGTSGGHVDQNQVAAGRSGPSQPGPGTGTDAGPRPGDGASVERITRPKDGHFGVIVVGDSMADQYPEAAGIWAGRLAYTVYLHVGTAKSWILQYCLPPVVQAATNAARPDAPWPYVMITPHLAPGDVDSDAVLVHGFIDAMGHFEKLAIVFPGEFAQSKFILEALDQWQFRPAQQNGQSKTVEVLLIIPEEPQ